MMKLLYWQHYQRLQVDIIPYKDIVLAKFRRDLVLKNLYENNYINKIQYEKFINKKIILKKRKKTFTEDTSYYVEDIRKNVVDQLGFDKVYKQGLNISTPINLEFTKNCYKIFKRRFN